MTPHYVVTRTRDAVVSICRSCGDTSGTTRTETADAERDELRDACNSWQSVAQEAEYLSEKFRAERDKYADKAERWAARHAALREDIEEARDLFDPGTLGHTRYQSFLARDDERGQS